MGLGLAFAIAYTIGAIWAIRILSYKVPGFSMHTVATSIWRMVIAAALMGEAVWLVTRQVGGNVGIDAVIRIVVGAVVGIVVYVAVLTALRAPELDALRRRLPTKSRL